MQIKQYSKVLLTSGETAFIVEIFDEGKMYLADIDRDDDTETDWVRPDEIVQVLQK